MNRWPTFLVFNNTADGIIRALAVIAISVIIVQYSTIFEEEYAKKLTELYIHPWWRFLVVALIITSAIWCPRVGILIALLALFYLSDMNILITPMTEL